MKPTIALCIMVKNEEATLPRLLASVEGFVDSIIALDTGSTDDTLLLLHEAGADVIEIPFQDFGRSRTQLMQFAKGKADWLLLLDADHVLTFYPAALREHTVEVLDPKVSCYAIQHTGNFSYWVTRLVRGDQDWRYIGATHEYLDRSTNPTRLLAMKVRHLGDGGSKADKFIRDRRLLLAELAEDPTNGRALFYLANTERDMGLLNSAYKRYKERAKMGGWEEERWMAQLNAAQISLDMLELFEAWITRPQRAEPLYWLSRVYAGRGMKAQVSGVETVRSAISLPKDEVLFVDHSAYGSIRFFSPYEPWQTIPGWYDFENVYKKFVELIPDGGTFVEVGVWLGRSLAAFDSYAKKAGKNINLVAVDTFQGTATEPQEAKVGASYGGEFEREFTLNMHRCGVLPAAIRSEPSARAAGRYFTESLDAVFIDGDHSYEGVTSDIKAWLPKIKKDGIIAGHDFDRPEVRRAVLNYFAEGDVRVDGRCWITSR